MDNYKIINKIDEFMKEHKVHKPTGELIRILPIEWLEFRIKLLVEIKKEETA